MNGAPSSMVSPGLWGFLAFFVLAVALYLLMRNMNARMRRMSYRAEELRREAEADGRTDRQETGDGEPATGSDDSSDPDDGAGPEGQTGAPSR